MSATTVKPAAAAAAGTAPAGYSKNFQTPHELRQFAAFNAALSSSLPRELIVLCTEYAHPATCLEQYQIAREYSVIPQGEEDRYLGTSKNGFKKTPPAHSIWVPETMAQIVNDSAPLRVLESALSAEDYAAARGEGSLPSKLDRVLGLPAHLVQPLLKGGAPRDFYRSICETNLPVARNISHPSQYSVTRSRDCFCNTSLVDFIPFLRKAIETNNEDVVFALLLVYLTIPENRRMRRICADMMNDLFHLALQSKCFGICDILIDASIYDFCYAPCGAGVVDECADYAILTFCKTLFFETDARTTTDCDLHSLFVRCVEKNNAEGAAYLLSSPTIKRLIRDAREFGWPAIANEALPSADFGLVWAPDPSNRVHVDKATKFNAATLEAPYTTLVTIHHDGRFIVSRRLAPLSKAKRDEAARMSALFKSLFPGPNANANAAATMPVPSAEPPQNPVQGATAAANWQRYMATASAGTDAKQRSQKKGK